MYALVSAVVGAAFGYAFSNTTPFYVTFLIAFFVSFFFLTFLHTLIRGTNWMFIIACRVFCAIAPIFFLWFIYGLPGVLFILLGFVGGFITAPIWYFISVVRKETTRNVIFSILSVLLLALVAVGALLFIKPILVYKLVNYGWIIAIFIAVPILAILAAMLLKGGYLIKARTFSIVVLTSILCIPLMIFGIIFSKGRTYDIYTASDMRALANVPNNYKTVFVLQNDIDFEGENVSWYGKCEEFNGIFEGNGYTLSNISYVGKPCEIDVSGDRYSFGLVGRNNGIIKNLNFENCVFEVDFYYESIMTDGYFGIIAGYNSKEANIYNCNLTDCYAKYYRHKYTSGSGWYQTTETQSVSAGYIVGAYSGVTGSKFDPAANSVTRKNEWKPDSEFFADSNNWILVNEKYGKTVY